jgi:hypothetical protein
MADPVEDKDSLAERLEEDREEMAIQVSELKEDYNLPHRWRLSVQEFPWPWIIGAVLTGFLLSRLPARRKEVYLWSEPFQRGPLREVHPPTSEKDGAGAKSKVWSIVKPIISTYIGRELYRRLRPLSKHAAGRSRNGRDRR